MCERYETWDEIQQRIAENYLEDSFKFEVEPGKEEEIPAHEWTQAIR